jgi:hypothetical protein
MSALALGRWLLVWAVATVLAGGAVHRAYAVEVDEAHPRALIASVWQEGRLVERRVLGAADAQAGAKLDPAIAARLSPGATLVYESIVGEGPVLAWTEETLAVSFVAGRDGVAATWGDRTAYMTPDDLLARQAYDKGINVPGLQLTLGLDVPFVLAALAEHLGTTARDLFERGRFRRIRTVRTIRTPAGAPAPLPAAVTPEALTNDSVRDSAIAGGRFLARGVDGDGRFRYLVDATSNRTLPGYDWPRHAGATYFLAQIAALSGDSGVSWAALRAASLLRDHAMVACGEHRCIGDEAVVDVGSTALAVLAFVEIAKSDLDRGYALLVPELAAFLRSQQRPDGELMHLYDRASQRPIDTQLLYYSGEAAFALSRAHSLLGDARDLDAASRVVAYLIGGAWRFFGSRYYWGEEHWTCQAMDDLWDRAPNRAALQFCLDWHAFGRKLQYRQGDSPFDADGAYGFGPLLTPRLTPVGSRSEAGLATLDAARRAGVAEADIRNLDEQMRRSLALLIRHQIRAESADAHLLADPGRVDGGMPGSEVDWQLRIDYAQHAGSAMVRWLGLLQPQPQPH